MKYRIFLVAINFIVFLFSARTSLAETGFPCPSGHGVSMMRGTSAHYFVAQGMPDSMNIKVVLYKNNSFKSICAPFFGLGLKEDKSLIDFRLNYVNLVSEGASQVINGDIVYSGAGAPEDKVALSCSAIFGKNPETGQDSTITLTNGRIHIKGTLIYSPNSKHERYGVKHEISNCVVIEGNKKMLSPGEFLSLERYFSAPEWY